MFSGIVEERGIIVAINDTETLGKKIAIQSTFPKDEISLGDSICVDGVCLTVIQKEPHLSFELAEETIRKTTFNNKKIGSSVNLERSLKVGDRIHGHIVSGHVDGVASLIKREEEKGSFKLYFSYPKNFSKYLTQKGSITISGVSLTLGEVNNESFCVYIIPHTEHVTTIGELSPGDSVNIEIDMIARYVEKMISERSNL